ncbi:hypothetical protein C2857_006299 [Epichloe festucae Fl1]|uniref:Uncharacterized protein n=1 Tax=Epichloe festucae (strain Fl1) TaxID=877507 RepID=A0A7S9PW72_EPIFF|nr:hypothetical protein C2857_006299 [Epichloe festucae Fl1]
MSSSNPGGLDTANGANGASRQASANHDAKAQTKKSNSEDAQREAKDILEQQIHFQDYKASFLDLYESATVFDLVLIGVSTVAAIIAGALHPTAPIVNACLVEFLARARTEGDAVAAPLHQFTLYYVYIFFLSLATWTVANSGFSYSASRITRSIRSQYLAAVLRQNIAIFDAGGTEDILANLTTNADLIQNALSSKLAITIAAFGNLAGTVAVCHALDSVLARILSWSFVVGTLVLILTGKATARYSVRSIEHSSAGAAVVDEAFGAIKTTTALGLQKQVYNAYMRCVESSSKDGFLLKMLTSCMVSLCASSGYVNVALGFWQGSVRLANGVTPFRNIVAIAIVLKSAAFVVFNVGSNLEAFQMTVAVMGRIHRIMRRGSPIDISSTQGQSSENIDGTIAFKHVSHVYPHRQNVTVLNDVNITFPAGKTVALVGPSGSGKSSVASLIMQFYRPVAGTITIDGTDISAFNLKSIRQKLRLVSQEPFLFNTTIFRNIEYGLLGDEAKCLSLEQKTKLVHEAAKAAQIHDFIVDNLPRGYDTLAGERGSKLSGGQIQRIAIARAIVGRPRVLILDEATSALDGETESKVLVSLKESCQNCTVVVIAHRLSTIRDADKIVVLQAGRLVEEGKHNDLINAGSIYSSLWNAQQTVGIVTDSDSPGDSSSRREGGHGNHHGEDLSLQGGREPDAKQDRVPSLVSLLKLAWQLNRQDRWLAFLGLACSLVAGLEEPMSAILFGKTVTALSQPLSGSAKVFMVSIVTEYAGLFCALAFASFVFLGAEGIIFAWCSERMLLRARGMALQQLLRMDMSFFDRPGNSAGSLSCFLASSIQDLAGISGSALSVILLCSSTALCGIITGMVFGGKLASLCLLLYPALAASGYFGEWLVGELEGHSSSFSNEAVELASESLQGIRTVAALSREDALLAEFDALLHASRSRSLKASVQTSFLYAMAQAIYYAGMALTFWYGSKLIIRHEYSLNQFIVVQSCMLMSAYSAGLVFSWTPSIGKAKHAAARLHMLMSETSSETEIQSQPSVTARGDDFSKDEAKVSVVADSMNDCIDFDSVAFAYPARPNTQVLTNITLSIPGGANVAFVGPTGSGKSTIVSLIQRFYNPTDGQIRIGGIAVSSFPISDYRCCIGYVSQDPILLSGSIRTNLLAGLVDNDEANSIPSDSVLAEVCQQADIYDLIQSLPDGFDTSIGTRGMQLSVGQKQRLAMARALLRRPRILLLDEATSSLDSLSESSIQGVLEKSSKGRTTISITHRLRTVTKADRIYFLNKGRIVEEGSHSELMGRRGEYYSMYIASNTGD